TRELEVGADGERRGSEGADQGCVGVRPARSPRAQSAVRLRVHARGQPDLTGRAAPEAGARGACRARILGLEAAPDLKVRPTALQAWSSAPASSSTAALWAGSSDPASIEHRPDVTLRQ